MFITPELFHNAPVGSPADEVGKLPKTIFPLVVSMALKSAAAVSVGFIYKPRVIPLAPPVWFIVEASNKLVKVNDPLVGLKVLETLNILLFTDGIVEPLTPNVNEFALVLPPLIVNEVDGPTDSKDEAIYIVEKNLAAF